MSLLEEVSCTFIIYVVAQATILYVIYNDIQYIINITICIVFLDKINILFMFLNGISAVSEEIYICIYTTVKLYLFSCCN